ncbi:MAG: IS1634 family transposase [Coriobacteriales bacterium]|jgi:hypothetical protein
MFVVVKKSKTSARQLVYIVESYRDENQKIRQRIIKKCGELSELQAQDPDVLDHLKEEAKRMTKESSSKEVELTINLSQPNSKSSPLVGYGHMFVESLYESLRIQKFIDRRIEDPKLAKKIGDTLEYFVVREFFVPLTSRKAGEGTEPLFPKFEKGTVPTLDTIGLIDRYTPDLMKHVYKIANKGHECSDKVASLDITSYHFNAVSKGKSRKRRTDATAMSEMILVQVGVLFDRYRNPVGYVLFPEGFSDTETLIGAINRLKKKFGFNRIVITSDRGFGSNATLASLHKSGNGYVVGRKVKNSPVEFQEAILDESGYKWNESGTFKFKTFRTERIVGDVVIPEKVISMWTSNNAAKMRQRRDKNIIDYLSQPNEFEFGKSKELDQYVKIHDTTETPYEKTDHNYFSFDAESYKRDMALDGYYALATTEMGIPESVIIRRYHNLQKINKAFSAPDPDVEGAPSNFWSNSDVQSYFLVKYLAMVIQRKLEHLLGGKYSYDEMRDALEEATCKNIGQDIYAFTKQTEVFHDIEDAFGVEFDNSFATLEMIRKYRKSVINALG